MPTPSEIIDMTASLMNDTGQSLYTDEACLPYFNMAIRELQELFELNSVPSTYQTSSILTIPASTVITVVGFTGLAPVLPSGLVEIQQLWESPTNGNNWTEMFKREFIQDYGIQVNQFRNWAWINQEIRLPPSNSIIDLKLDYIRSIFPTPILISQIGNDLNIINCTSFLGYRTAALCAEFIGENPTRAQSLNQDASIALDRTLGISTKGKQSIVTRRLPFRSNYKR